MRISEARAPFIKTPVHAFDLAYDLLISLAPVLIWSTYVFGPRVLSICAIGGVCTAVFDLLIRIIFKIQKNFIPDPLAAAFGILACFTLPVSAPLWAPVAAAGLTAAAKNIRYFRGRRALNPFVFSAAAMNLIFPSVMNVFTRPRAYFRPFVWKVGEKLISDYRVISPLEYIKDGDVYEEGALAQFIGYASGHIGEIAVCAMLFSAIWLIYRRRLDIRTVAAFLVPIFVLGLIFPSDDAESNYYAYSLILSGAAVFLSVFASAEGSTVPATKVGRIIFGAANGIIIFLTRKFFGGAEFGYYSVLLLGLLTPFIEKLTLPKPTGVKNEKR